MPVSDSIIEQLIEDHRSVERLFQRYEAAGPGVDREQLARDIIVGLVRHSEAEEQFVYPAAREVIANGSAVIEHDIGEHARAERLMNELDGMPGDDPAFDGVMRKVITEIREHVAREESAMLPQLGNALSEDSLRELAANAERAKAAAPTHPHPLAPDHPPFNKVLGPGSALVDRVRDWLANKTKDTSAGR